MYLGLDLRAHMFESSAVNVRRCLLGAGRPSGTVGVISDSGPLAPSEVRPFEGGSAGRSVVSLIYVCECFKGVRAANEASSITIWDVISVVEGMEQGQVRVAQSGLRSPTRRQEQEDEVNKSKEIPQRFSSSDA